MFSSGASQVSNSTLYAEDVFACTTYTGNGSTQTITNGIDLAGKGGLVWSKNRGASGGNFLYHTVRGLNTLRTDQTAAELAEVPGYDLTGYTGAGYTLYVSVNTNINASANTYVSWTFRNADNFYGHSVVTKSSGSNATASFSNLTTLGMVRVKRTDSTGSWYVWHRSLTAGKLLIGETTAAEATLGHITVSGTTVTLVNGVIADGSYLVEAWAHDTSTDGIIQCGSFTTDGSGNATVNHGWSAGVQFAKIKASSTTSDWEMFDSARSPAWSADNRLRANLSNAEDTVTRLSASGTSISFTGLSASQTYIYVFIVAPT